MRERWCQVSFAAIAFVLLWLDLFFLPLSPVSPDLDPSWCGALIHFSALKLQFGRDIVFTYGPLAHLTSFVYTGELFTTRVIYEFVSKTVFTAILGLTILFLPKLWRPIFFLFVLLFIWVDPISDALYFLVIVCASAVLFRQRDYPVSFLILVGILFGVCSLIKFTYLLLVLLALGLLSVFYLLERRPLRAITLGGSFIGAFLFAWHLAGQEFSSLAFYLINSIDVALGYKEAMGSPVSSNWILAAGVAALVLGLVQCGYVFKHSRRLSTLCLVLFFAGTAWLSWTRAFVRADDHVLSFFGLFPAASLALWVPTEPRPEIRRVGYSINLLILIICLSGIFMQQPALITQAVPDTFSRISRSFRVVTALGDTVHQLQVQLQEARSSNDLPRIRNEVGNKSIDVFGYEQGVALLNNLNYTPRPIFQGYSAYTSRLIGANTAFYISDRAPDYVLFKYQPIDQRYPSSEDAGVLLQLFLRYTPLFDERGYSLWKRSRQAQTLSADVTQSHSLLIDELCDVPAHQNVWVEIDFPKSVRGRLRSLFYKPPPIEIRTNDTEGRQFTHKLIPSMSGAGFIINPELETPSDVLESAIGGRTTAIVTFLVDVPHESRRYYQRRLSCRMRSLPAWPTARVEDPHARKLLYRELFGDQGADLELAEDFQNASEVLVNRDSAGLTGFSALNEVNLAMKDQKLQIDAVGTDPQVLLPQIPLRAGQHGILRIDIESPADTALQLFYLPAGVSHYGAYQMNRFVRRGKNTIYFELNDTELAGGPLRLDPGMVAGKYLITGYEVRITPPNSE